MIDAYPKWEDRIDTRFYTHLKWHMFQLSTDSDATCAYIYACIFTISHTYEYVHISAPTAHIRMPPRHKVCRHLCVWSLERSTRSVTSGHRHLLRCVLLLLRVCACVWCLLRKTIRSGLGCSLIAVSLSERELGWLAASDCRVLPVVAMLPV